MAERDLPRFASQPFVTITKGGCASVVVVVVADVLRWALLAAAIATSLSILATCIVMPVAMKLPLATAECMSAWACSSTLHCGLHDSTMFATYYKQYRLFFVRLLWSSIVPAAILGLYVLFLPNNSASS